MLKLLISLALLSPFAIAQFNTCFPSVDTNSVQTNAFDFSGVDKFGLALFRQLSSSSQQNLLISPFSIWSVLSLALMGSQGTTKTQLEQVLGLPSNKLQAFRTKSVLDFIMSGTGLRSSDSPKMLSIDHAYFDQGLTLRDCVRNVLFKLDVVNFSDAERTADKINTDVSRATGGEIVDFLKPSSILNAVFVLINAIYFKGSWESEFKPEKTTNAPFTLAPSSLGAQQTIDIPTMARTGTMRIAFSQVMGSDVLELPYRNSNTSMFLILPRDQNANLQDVLQNLTPFSFLDVRNTMRSLPVSLTMPKFDLKTEIEGELRAAMESLGLSDMFNPSRANFKDFTADPVFIDAAIHQAKVRVDEQGTVAAAATGLVATRSGPGQFINFNLNRPFIFSIFDKTVKITLFAGIVRDPRA